MTKKLRLCAVCGHGLNLLGPDPDDPVAYIHSPGTGADHPAVPVEAGEVPMRPVCDVCNLVTSPEEVYTWPCHDFVMPNGSANDGDWALCPGCHGLALNGRWDELIEVVLGDFVEQHGEKVREQIEPQIRAFHKQFREHTYDTPYRGLPVQYLHANQ